MDRFNLKTSSGVTLVELLIVLAIAAILAQIALPDFRDIMQNNRSAARINELQTSLTFARSEAIKRNTPVMLCKSTNGATCVNSGENWQTGWIVFADQDGSGAPNGDEVLAFHGNAGEQFTLTFTEQSVAYDGSGMATVGQSNTFTLCDDRGAANAKGVIIGASGRPRLAADGDSLACS
jgi:type IV fimbrial biogenesis protein FimT